MFLDRVWITGISNYNVIRPRALPFSILTSSETFTVRCTFIRVSKQAERTSYFSANFPIYRICGKRRDGGRLGGFRKRKAFIVRFHQRGTPDRGSALRSDSTLNISPSRLASYHIALHLTAVDGDDENFDDADGNKYFPAYRIDGTSGTTAFGPAARPP